MASEWEKITGVAPDAQDYLSYPDGRPLGFVNPALEVEDPASYRVEVHDLATGESTFLSDQEASRQPGLRQAAILARTGLGGHVVSPDGRTYIVPRAEIAAQSASQMATDKTRPGRLGGLRMALAALGDPLA